MSTNNLPKKERSFYASVHYWLKYNYGVASKCENKDCSKKSINYQWAKKREKEYAYKRENFINLCRSCHAKYDCTDETRKKLRTLNPRTHNTHCHKGHEFTVENTYLHKGTRSCTECKKTRNKEWSKNNIESVRLSRKKCYDKNKYTWAKFNKPNRKII